MALRVSLNPGMPPQSGGEFHSPPIYSVDNPTSDSPCRMAATVSFNLDRMEKQANRAVGMKEQARRAGRRSNRGQETPDSCDWSNRRFPSSPHSTAYYG